jgi:hypothetical protein
MNENINTENESINGDLSVFPSIELAYPIAVASYDAVSKRLDSLDGRLQSIIAFATIVFVAVVSMANTNQVCFSSWWFYSAAGVYVAAACVGTFARLYGSAQALDPKLLFDEWLWKDKIEFMKDMIYFASEAFDHNNKLTERKWQAAVFVSAAFFVQGVCLVFWLA